MDGTVSQISEDKKYSNKVKCRYMNKLILLLI